MVTTQKDEVNSDVYRIKQPSSAKPMPVALVHGHIYNSKTKQPMLANISYNELGEKKEIGSANSNPNTGAYSIILPVGKKFAYHAVKDGFIAVHNNIDLSTLSAYKEVSVDLYLVLGLVIYMVIV